MNKPRLNIYDHLIRERTMKALKECEEHLDEVLERCTRLAEENARIRDEKYKDEELQKLIEYNKELQSQYGHGFSISNQEWENINSWRKKHNTEKHGGPHPYSGAIGGELTYEFVPTSIGTVCTVKCHCGESYTFRDL